MKLTKQEFRIMQNQIAIMKALLNLNVNLTGDNIGAAHARDLIKTAIVDTNTLLDYK